MSGGSHLFAVFFVQSAVGQQNVVTQNRFDFVGAKLRGLPENSRNARRRLRFLPEAGWLINHHFPIYQFGRRRVMIQFAAFVPDDAPVSNAAAPRDAAFGRVGGFVVIGESPVGKAFAGNAPQNFRNDIGRNGFNGFGECFVKIFLAADAQTVTRFSAFSGVRLNFVRQCGNESF